MRHILFILFFGLTVTANSQNITMSQPFTNAQFMSPALVGDGIFQQRIQASIRNQMFFGNSVASTIVAGWDGRINKRKEDDGNYNYLGVGLQLMSDQLSGGLIQTNYLTLNLAYHLFFDAYGRQNLALGMGGTYAQSTINQNKLSLGESLQNELGLSSGSGAVPISFVKSASNVTANTGLAYTSHDEDTYVQFGLNAFFNSMPTIVQNASSQSAIMRNSMFVNFEKKFGEDEYTFVLHGYYSNRFKNGNYNQQMVAGGSFGLPILYKYEQSRRLYLGCYYRFNEAVVPTISWMMEKYTMGLSYDLGMSSQTGAAVKQNIFEITLSSSFGKRRNEYLRTLFD